MAIAIALIPVALTASLASVTSKTYAAAGTSGEKKPASTRTYMRDSGSVTAPLTAKKTTSPIMVICRARIAPKRSEMMPQNMHPKTTPTYCTELIAPAQEATASSSELELSCRWNGISGTSAESPKKSANEQNAAGIVAYREAPDIATSAAAGDGCVVACRLLYGLKRSAQVGSVRRGCRGVPTGTAATPTPPGAPSGSGCHPRAGGARCDVPHNRVPNFSCHLSG